MLLVCRRCRTRYSVGAARCPQCTSTSHYVQGEEPEGDDMAKITAHGGPTDKRTGQGLDAGEAARPPAGSSPAAATSAAQGGQVPAGTVAEVLAWVGGDGDRAARALQVERDKAEPRSTLVAELERRVEF